MKLYNPLSKKNRRNKKESERLARLCEQKALMLCTQYQQNILYSDTKGTGNNKDHDIIISLTSIPSRLDLIIYTIESLFQQTLRADRVILCLGKEKIASDKIPLSLKQLEKRGLEIKFYDEDLGPYTKYFYTLKENPNSLIVTVDDDILYSHDMVEKLYRAYQKEPNVIHCHRGHEITFENSKLSSYRKWHFSSQMEKASKLIFPTGVGGVLYFPDCLHEDALNKELFKKLCPNADDVWLKAMSLRKGVLCKTIKQSSPFAFSSPNIPFSQTETLKRKNKQNNGNNKKINDVFNFFSLKEQLS